MVSKVIKELIANNGGNKRSIAAKLGVTPQYLGQLESGKRQKPNAELTAKIREVYNVDILAGKKTDGSLSSKKHETLSVREDIWEEIKSSNEHYRDQNSELVSMMKALIQQTTLKPKRKG